MIAYDNTSMGSTRSRRRRPTGRALGRCSSTVPERRRGGVVARQPIVGAHDEQRRRRSALWIAATDGSGAREVEVAGLGAIDATYNPADDGTLLIRGRRDLSTSTALSDRPEGDGPSRVQPPRRHGLRRRLGAGRACVLARRPDDRAQLGRGHPDDARSAPISSMSTGPTIGACRCRRGRDRTTARRGPCSRRTAGGSRWSRGSARRAARRPTRSQSRPPTARRRPRYRPGVANQSLVKTWSPDGTKVIVGARGRQ